MLEFVAVFVGGGLGSIIRFGLSQFIPRGADDIHWATFATNMVGALLIGFLFHMAYGHLQGPCGIQEVGDYLLAEEIWQERLWGEDPEALDRRRNMLDDLASFSRIALLASQKQLK